VWLLVAAAVVVPILAAAGMVVLAGLADTFLM
jgi:hypothetical protein